MVREQGCTDKSPGCGYNDNCEDTDSITTKWRCGRDRSGKWRKYFGRGAKQLSYNFNYGQFSQAMFGDVSRTPFFVIASSISLRAGCF